MSPISVKQLDLILFLVVLLIAISDCTQRIKRMYAMCPPKFTKIGNECYYVSTERLNWLESHFACKDKNSKLAEPIKYEDRALRKFMLHNDTDKIEKWIGGVYNWERNKWQWGQTGRTVVYQSFSQMDPRSRQDLKYHCAVLNPALKYRWSAKICVEKFQYICQHRMPYVDEINKQKVYDRWNETFPNEKANEVEMFMDQPANNNTRRIKEKRQRIEQRMIRKPLQLNVTHEVYRHVDVDQLLHENSIRPTTPRPVNRKEKRRRRPKRRRTTAKPISTTQTPDILNDAAANSNGRLIIPIADLGSPIVESVFNDDYYNIVKHNRTMMHPFLPTRPTAAPTKRRRKQRRRKPSTDKQRHKNRQENETTNKHHPPRQENETTNNQHPSRQENETSKNHHPSNDVTEKVQFDDIEKSSIYRAKLLRREKEASRMAEAKRQLEENLRKQEAKKRIEQEKQQLEEEHRKYLDKQMEKERELQREREAYEKQMLEYREEEERRRGEEKLRLKELEILERERLEEEQQRAERKLREKNEREEIRRQEESRLREEAEAKLLEEQRKKEEIERKMENERLAEEQRLIAEQKRREQERNEAEGLKRKEEEKLHKIEEEKQRKRQELLERFKKLTPEQKQEYLKRRRQMKNESTIPE